MYGYEYIHDKFFALSAPVVDGFCIPFTISCQKQDESVPSTAESSKDQPSPLGDKGDPSMKSGDAEAKPPPTETPQEKNVEEDSDPAPTAQAPEEKVKDHQSASPKDFQAEDPLANTDSSSSQPPSSEESKSE